jgi:hypothetical protein
MTKIVEGRVISASVAFVSIHKLKSYDDNICYHTISHLNSVAKHCNRKRGEIIILSSLTGLVFIAPDNAAENLIEFLNNFIPKCYDSGLPLKIGITHGDIEELKDVDGRINYIGTPLNHAARVLFSEKNQGCLAEQSYRNFYQHVFGPTKSPAFIFSTKKINVKGKSHDKSKFVCYAPNSGRFQFRKKLLSQMLPKIRKPANPVAGVALAYDLPKFSAGDRSQLSQRFRSISDMFQALKNNTAIPAKSRLFFLPGGDGGVVILTEVKASVFEIVSKFVQLLEIESESRDASIGVKSRIGAHYGVIFLYKNADGIIRPTGKTCFVADEIASDSLARSSGGIVFSEQLIDSLSSGSSTRLNDTFEELPAIKKGAAKNIKRFIPRTIQESREHPLFVKLFGPHGSWEHL